MPLPGTRVLPEGWAAHHQPVVESTMLDATVALRDPSAPPVSSGWNDTIEQTGTVPAPTYWTGGARIQMLNQQGREPVVAGDQETVADYLVVISAAVTPGEGHRVKVTACDDAALTGRELRVVTVVRGSHRFERDLFCELTD